MSRRRSLEGPWFEGHFAVPADRGDAPWLMVRSPTEATLLFHVPAPQPARRELEGMHLLDLERPEVDGAWQPQLFEGRHDWWLAGSGAAGTRQPEVADHPVLRGIVDRALDVLAENDRDVLDLGATQLRREAAEMRERHALRPRPELALDHERARSHVRHLAARMLDPAEAARLEPRHAAFGFAGVLETAYGPVTVHIETGPVVRIDAVPSVLLVGRGSNGPLEFSLSARRSAGGWDAVSPKHDLAQQAADDILALVHRTYPEQIRSAFAAWACTTLAKADMASAAAARSDAIMVSIVDGLEERAAAADERAARMQDASAPRP
ncbi:hypothetical protein PQI07_27175 [Methylobacterium sp. 092160098-2]|uniref:hypothetical protein n=1 Tax=Methylobacterium sp. 092160098-2 TaxID=3025129 RepID=UPI002381CD1D|nr:hypothetical protein [Methylobacterium sp. 092160098-2]MDE4914357.1 hypothetical protein [Methylobacterium sp. 092160098-2]